jgi:hypothetical protein
LPYHDSTEVRPLAPRSDLGPREADSKAFEQFPTLVGCLFRLYPQRYATGPVPAVMSLALGADFEGLESN